MASEEKTKVNLEIAKYAAYIISWIVAVLLAYGAMNTRVTVIETEMNHKVGKEELFNKIDELEIKISMKIENEVKKINQNQNKSKEH